MGKKQPREPFNRLQDEDKMLKITGLKPELHKSNRMALCFILPGESTEKQFSFSIKTWTMEHVFELIQLFYLEFRSKSQTAQTKTVFRRIFNAASGFDH